MGECVDWTDDVVGMCVCLCKAPGQAYSIRISVRAYSRSEKRRTAGRIEARSSRKARHLCVIGPKRSNSQSQTKEKGTGGWGSMIKMSLFFSQAVDKS